MSTNAEILVLSSIPTERAQFSWHDYLFFLILLLLSAAIGIYFGFMQKKKPTADEYLLGGKEMGVFEISLSLISSTISGITVLSVPSEVYRYGVSYGLSIPAIVLLLVFSYICVLPVFTKLQTSSTYEYIQLRFNKTLRSISSLLYGLNMFCYLPIVIYVPALALAQGTGFNVHYITPGICAICIFYTTVGGLKAVVWTDVLQLIVMAGATIVILIVGTRVSGDFPTVWERAYLSGRLTLDFDPDVTKRDTVWTNSLGMFFFWQGIITFHQGTVQKCLALPNRQKMRRAYVIYGLGITALLTSSVYTGLLIYSKYHDCDPFAANKINAHDQVLPFYILDTTSHLTGLTGVFVAGVFSASLSSLSAAMNALSCTIYRDFIERHLPNNTVKTKYEGCILKLIVVTVGIISTVLVFVVQYFESCLEVGISMGSIVQGPTVGLFALGMFIPMANSRGAFWGTLGSLIIMGWIIFTSLYYKLNGYITIPTKDISVEECLLNTTLQLTDVNRSMEVPFVYRISHYYYGLMGSLLVIIIAMPISYFTRNTTSSQQQNSDLISPAMRWAIAKQEAPKYYSVYKAKQTVTTQSS